MRTRRARVAAPVAIGLGLLVLSWVLVELHAVFDEERAERERSVVENERTLEAYASQALIDALARSLRVARGRIEAALGDPLTSPRDLFWARGGVQVLPRLRPSPGDATTPAGDVYAALRSSRPLDLPPASPWADRVASFERLRSALAERDEARVESLVRAILEQRSLFVIRAGLDVPYMLAMLELLWESAVPDPSLFERALRSGFGEPGSVSFVPGLQARWLEAASRLSRSDFDRLGSRIVELSAAVGVPHDDFAARLHEGPGERVAYDPAWRAPHLAGSWYVEPGAFTGRAAGVRVDVAATLAGIEREMRERGLLRADDQLQLAPASGPVTPVDELAPRLESPASARARSRARSLYSVKSGLLLLCGGLALGIAGLAALAHRHRLRLVELRSELVSAVSHELRTPLASIRLQAETLARRLQGRAEARDYPERIVRDVDGLSFLVENILSFNRLERGGWRPERARVSLRELVGGLREDLERQIPRKLSISLQGEGDVELFADPDLMKLLFGNLLRNAVTHNEREPAIARIAWDRGPTGITVRVRDNGTGLPPGSEERIFRDFYRGSSGGPRGTGLGLGICRRILRVHGGDLRVASTSALGTVLELRLPEGGA